MTTFDKIKHNPLVRNYGGTTVALMALVVLFAFLNEHFLSTRNFTNVLLQMTVIALMAFGMTFVLMMGEIDLSVGSIAALSGVTLGLILTLGAPWWLACLASIGVGILCGLFNGSVSAFFGIPTFIVTVATMGIFRGIAYAVTDSKPIPIEDEAVIVLGNNSFLGLPIPIYVMLVLLVVMAVLLGRTRFGREITLTGGNRTAARFAGIPVLRHQISVFVIAGVASAIAGILMSSRLYSAQPNAATSYELDAIASAVLGGTSLTGGIGTVPATFIGALIIAVVNNGMNLMGLDYYFQNIVKGLIIIIAVFIDVRNKRNKLGA